MTLPDVSRRTFGIVAGATVMAEALAPGPSSAVGIEPNATWDLSDIYYDDAHWESARQAVLVALPGVACLKGTLGTSAGSLYSACAAISDIERVAIRLDTYARLASDADTTSDPARTRLQLAEDVSTKMGEATAWFGPELIAVGSERIETLIGADLRLRRFAFGLRDTFRQASHRLSEDGEALLAASTALTGAPAMIRGELMAQNIVRAEVKLSTGERVVVNETTFATLSRMAERADRKLVYDAYWSGYAPLKGALGATLNAAVQGDVFTARARRFPTARAAALASANIPETVYTTMLAEVERGLPVLHRYHGLRRRLLNLPDLCDYDLAVPLGKTTRSFDLPKIRALMLAAVQPLGRPYVDRLTDATGQRWMDAFPRPGKAGGGYSNPGAYDIHPYVLLNLTPTYAGATSFAHEWGHAMHALLVKAAQPFDTYNTPTLVQEIASTCHEQLLVLHMIEIARSREEKLFFLGQRMETFAFVFFRQAMRAQFEAEMHRLVEASEILSGDRLTKLYHDLTVRYYGQGVSTDPAYAIEWARQGQYYDPFYVFQYATSITGAVHFARSILEQGAPQRDRYLAMLQRGGSDYGYEVLRSGGLDLADALPYRTLLAEFGRTLDAADALAG